MEKLRVVWSMSIVAMDERFNNTYIAVHNLAQLQVFLTCWELTLKKAHDFCWDHLKILMLRAGLLPYKMIVHFWTSLKEFTKAWAIFLSQITSCLYRHWKSCLKPKLPSFLCSMWFGYLLKQFWVFQNARFSTVSGLSLEL